jgi:hypothetical protein
MAAKFKKGIDLNAQRAVNGADPTSATDLATKQYVDAKADSRDWKESVRAASTANVTIASALTNGSSMDGVTLATGDRVLLKNQTAPAENGIYIVVASGAASRSGDADTSAEVTAGMTVSVEEGTANGDKRFVLTTNNPITLGTTGLTFTPDAGGALTQAYQTVQENGSNLTQRNNLNFGTGVVATDNSGSSRTDVDIDTAVVVRKFAADCAATTNPQTFTHGLGTDITVQVWAASGSELVYPDITKSATSGGQVTVDWGSAPAAADYRVVVHG